MTKRWPRVLLDLGPLPLIDRVLDRQGMEAEDPAHDFQVGLARAGDVHPDRSFALLGEEPGELFLPRLPDRTAAIGEDAHARAEC